MLPPSSLSGELTETISPNAFMSTTVPNAASASRPSIFEPSLTQLVPFHSNIRTCPALFPFSSLPGEPTTILSPTAFIATLNPALSLEPSPSVFTSLPSLIQIVPLNFQARIAPLVFVLSLSGAPATTISPTSFMSTLNPYKSPTNSPAVDDEAPS